MATTSAAVDPAAATATLEEYDAAQEARDLDRVASCFAQDAVFESAEGHAFRGIDAICRYHQWVWRLPSIRYRDKGLGLNVVGRTASWEGVMSSVTEEGIELESPLLVLYEMNDDAKIIRVVVQADRWLLVRQAAQQAGYPLGPVLRWFSSQIDATLTKDMPAAD